MFNKAINIINSLIDFIFPKICIVTNEKLVESNSNPYVKDEIIQNLEKLSLSELSELKVKINNPNCFSLYRFKNNSPIQTIIHYIKYNGFKNLGIVLGELIGKELLASNYSFLLDYNYIIPIPLHKSKIRERGYNQSKYIAIGINKHFNLMFNDNSFIRKKDTLSQTKLSVEERHENLKDAFAVIPEYCKTLKDKKIILVDDVITTGATMKEAIKTLTRAGISDIFVISAALTVFD
ncbi:MAG: ComF family protein [Ignavibacteria bacterium]|nr:ComF family protein [Ignavibacteria bacterium]